MGLDQYVCCYQGEKPDEEVDFELDKSIERSHLHTWRKHPDLHGWMEDLYNHKGGQNEFNCVNLWLSREDIQDLKKSIKENSLPYTSGFFFGESDGSEKEEDLEFCERALDKINNGYQIYYTSWY